MVDFMERMEKVSKYLKGIPPEQVVKGILNYFDSNQLEGFVTFMKEERGEAEDEYEEE